MLDHKFPGYGIMFHLFHEKRCQEEFSKVGSPPAGSFNDLATAYMAFPDRTISHLFSLGSLTPQVLPRTASPYAVLCLAGMASLVLP